MKRLLLLLLVGLCCLMPLYAQRMESIKANPDYLWAEIISDGDNDDADRMALESLSDKIAALSGFTVPAYQAMALMRTYLHDLSDHSGSIRSGLSVLRYIQRKDMEHVFDRRRQLVEQLLASAKAIYTSGDKAAAFPYYYWAQTYLLSLPRSLQGPLSSTSSTLESLRSEGYSYHPGKSRMPHLVRETALLRSILEEKEKIIQRAEPEPEPLPATDTVKKRYALFPPADYPLPRELVSLPVEVLSIPDLPIPEIHEAQRMRTIVAASACVPIEKGYGLSVGLLKGLHGGYAAFHGNFRNTRSAYQCLSDGTLPDGGYIWTSPRAGKTREHWMVTAGYLGTWSLKSRFSVYAGAGYGIDRTCWMDTDGLWARVSDLSCQGVALETGSFYSIPFEHRYAFVTQVGIGTIAFRSFVLTAGIGIEF